MFDAIRSAIQRRLFPRQAPADPKTVLGLSPDQLGTLLDLRAHPGWVYYQQALQELATHQASVLLAGQASHDHYLFQSGVIEAFRRLTMLPDVLATHHTRLTTHDQSQRHDAGPDFLLNTPWYTARRNGTGSTG